MKECIVLWGQVYLFNAWEGCALPSDGQVNYYSIPNSQQPGLLKEMDLGSVRPVHGICRM